MNATTTIAAANDTAVIFMIERKPLQEAATFLARKLVERRNTIPILNYVLLAADAAGRVTICGNDLDIEATASLPGEGSPGGAVVVNAQALADAVKGCADVSVMLEIIGNSCRVSGGNSVSDLATLPASDFPHMAAVVGGVPLQMEGARLVQDLARVSPAMSKEETRYYLNGILLHAATLGGGDNPERALRFVATDGHRVHMTTQPLPAGAETLPDVILPRKSIAIVAQLLNPPRTKAPLSDVRFDISPTRFQVRLGDWVVISKTIDGTFPDYTRVIPSCGGALLTVDGEEMAAAVGRITKIGGKNKPCVRIDAADGSARLACKIVDDKGTQRSRESVSAEFRTAQSTTLGDAVNVTRPSCILDDPAPAQLIGFNGGYLANIIAAFGKGAVSFCFQDGAAPTLITAPASPDFLVVLMPMRVSVLDDGDVAVEPLADAEAEPESEADAEAAETEPEALVIESSDPMEAEPETVPPIGDEAPAAAEDPADPLQAENAELRGRLDRIEAALAELSAQISTPRPDSGPLSAETAPEAQTQPETVTHAQPEAEPGVMASIIADLAARLEAAEARAARERAQRIRCVGWRQRRRDRVQDARLALAGSNAQLEAELLAAEERAAQLVGRIGELETEAARYAPLAAALAAYAQPAPAAESAPVAPTAPVASRPHVFGAIR
jgi:DNA polymerase-3 subunit beta